MELLGLAWKGPSESAETMPARPWEGPEGEMGSGTPEGGLNRCGGNGALVEKRVPGVMQQTPASSVCAELWCQELRKPWAVS